MFDPKNFDNTNDGQTVNWSDQWSYPLQYIYESDFARRQYNCMLHRVKVAMRGRPSRNLYQEELTSNIKKIGDVQKRDAYTKACLQVPEGRSFALRNAVQNRANQMAGGVDSYQYQINDTIGVIEDDTEALLSATCEQDYIKNHLSRFAETFSRDLTQAGITATLVKYCPETDQNRVLRINPKNIWFDTKYSATGEERFRGYSYMDSWRHVKEMIEKDGDEVNLSIKAPTNSLFSSDGSLNLSAKVGKRKIRSLNGLDIYVENLNKMATSTQLQGNVWSTYEEYEHDLRTAYNLGWYRTLATDAKAKTNNGYQGDDVEITILYDLVNKIEFKILNRRYVISANSKAFKRQLVYSSYDPRTGEEVKQIRDFELDCPLKFEWENVEDRDLAPYPSSTLMTLLDTFDELCALRAKRKHVADILSILRIETNAADAESLRGVLNIMGIVLDDIQGEINTINFAYDFTPLDSQIEYHENLIKRTLNAYDEFDALQAMGDRASAAESGMALSAVAQGLTTHQNAIMSMYADIARQCIANRVAYSPRQEFPVYNKGSYSVVTAQQMALTATIDVKPKLAKKIEERLLSSAALTALGALGQNINQEGVATLIEIALMGTVPRHLARTFINEPGASEQEIALARQQGQQQAQILAQNQQSYQRNPYPYESQNVLDNYSPEEVEQIIGVMARDQGLNSLSDLDNQSPEIRGERSGMTIEERERANADLTATPEAAGVIANELAL